MCGCCYVLVRHRACSHVRVRACVHFALCLRVGEKDSCRERRGGDRGKGITQERESGREGERGGRREGGRGRGRGRDRSNNSVALLRHLTFDVLAVSHTQFCVGAGGRERESEKKRESERTRESEMF